MSINLLITLSYWLPQVPPVGLAAVVLLSKERSLTVDGSIG
jgi:hypothetical protein